MMKKPTTELTDLLEQKELALAAVEKDASELRKQIEALRQTISLLSNRTGYEEYLALSKKSDQSGNAELNQPTSITLVEADPAEAPVKQAGSITEAVIQTLDVKQGKTVEDIFNILRISSSVSITRDSVAKTLSRLNAHGKVKKIGFATYCLAKPKGESPAVTGLSDQPTP